jgi:hypothetical protein
MTASEAISSRKLSPIDARARTHTHTYIHTRCDRELEEEKKKKKNSKLDSKLSYQVIGKQK